MPATRQTGHRLYYTWVSKTLVTSTYAITSWTPQGDQYVNSNIMVPWLAPKEITVPEKSRITTMADGSIRADGYYKFTWTFDYWTFGMMTYFLNTFNLGSPIYSVPVTVMTYDPTDTAVFLQCYVARPVIIGGQDVEWHWAGYKNVKLNFTVGTVITS
jgi:hypothetical protein